jgi:hypothetical protein
MNSTITHTVARYIALPLVSAGIIGGAALGMAGMANAATLVPTDPQPGIVATPSVKAHPAPDAQPGARWHKGMHHVAVLAPSAVR